MFTGLVLSIVNVLHVMTNVRPERRETYAPHYHRNKLVTARKATTTRDKIKFISQC